MSEETFSDVIDTRRQQCLDPLQNYFLQEHNQIFTKHVHSVAIVILESSLLTEIVE